MSAAFHTQEPGFFVRGILQGDVAILSRAITLVESQNEAHRQLAQQIMEGVMHATGNSFRLGITGVPGVGKSTFIESFGKEVVARGHKLAVLAIDPSSAKSKGSILGDKTRMEELSAMQGVYIRPSPNSGTLGGVTRSTFETILLCEAAGFDFIIVETVGVGQSELAVSKISDFFLLLMLAGAGDELQGIKRGIMEMADALVITKADGANVEKAKAARAEYAHAMHLLQEPESGWPARTLVCSSLTGLGITEVYDMIAGYRQFVNASGYFANKRQQQQYGLFLSALEEQLKQKFYNHPGIRQRMEIIRDQGRKGLIQPFIQAKILLEDFFKSQS
jgi:LAO/AO transport system kinase